MKEVLDDIERWRAGGHRVAVARVVGTEGSSPRDPGATMVVNDAGEVAGSVSGGCVEGAVVERRARGARRRARARRDLVRLLRRRGVRGRADVRRHDPPVRGADRLVSALRASSATRCARSEPVALATVIAGPNVGAKLLVRPGGDARAARSANADLDRVVDPRRAAASSRPGITSTRHYGEHGEAREEAVTVFIESFALPPRMIIFGAVDFTAALVRVAKVLGYRVTVCDARAVFATVQRFPMADEVVNDWPDRYLAKIGDELGPRDAVCVLTHDHKFDVPGDRGGGEDRTSATSARWDRAARTRSGAMRLREHGLARRRDRTGHVADRPRRRRAHAGGDGGRDLRGDHRHAHRPPASRRCATPPVRFTDRPRAPRGRLVDLGIAGRRAAVAAASQGLGYATAEALAPEGVRGRDLRPPHATRSRQPRPRDRARARFRSSPTSRRPTARPASSATRATRSAASTSSSPTRADRRPGDFATHDRRPVPRARSS